MDYESSWFIFFAVSIFFSPLIVGFILVVIAWIKDWPKLERIGVNVTLVGVAIIVLSILGAAGC